MEDVNNRKLMQIQSNTSEIKTIVLENNRLLRDFMKLSARYTKLKIEYMRVCEKYEKLKVEHQKSIEILCEYQCNDNVKFG